MKIYIVEDDPEIRELESYALKSSGYETMEFAEGSSFFEAIRREKPALVLLDVMLPGQDGLSILKQLRSQADTMSLPVILVTARSTELDTVRGLDLGADDLAELSLHFHINSCIFNAVFSHSISFLSLNTLKGSTENSVLPFQSSGNP